MSEEGERRAFFDRSFLPPARLEFVVLADTHYMVDPGARPLEFESRRKQTARVEHALRLVAALDVPLVVHLGDITQEYPGSALHERAFAEAKAQLDRHLGGTRVLHVAGNQDVGDKPDPTMPTEPVTEVSLAAYERIFGPTWHSLDVGDCHFTIVNSSILNGSLPAAEAQRAWLEHDLAAHAGKRRFLFLHHPPYLYEPDEPALGHYDTLAEPARRWLLGLVRRHEVECVFAGHSHFAWCDRVGDRTRYYVCVSTSFTRPGFGELFSSGPADEQGRDDHEKLGFSLVRVQEGGVRVHFVRTRGMMAGPVGRGTSAASEGGMAERRLLTRLPFDLPGSPIGVTLTHPLANVTDVPLAWPSAVRQRVRNDYPFLALLEMGTRYVRLPAADLGDTLLRRRVALLRDEGPSVTAMWLWEEDLDLVRAVKGLGGLVETVEVQLPGVTLPSERCVAVLRRLAESGVAVSLAPVLPKEMVPGKQLRRTRIGYRLEELAALGTHLGTLGARADRVVVRIAGVESPWDTVRAAVSGGLPPQIGAVDWLVDLPADEEWRHTSRAAEAAFAAALNAGCRLFLEPLIDLDRTMDVSHGLLDRRCNPRPAFHAVRCANTILFAGVEAGRTDVVVERMDRASAMAFRRAGERFELHLPSEKGRQVRLRVQRLDGRVSEWDLTEC